MQRKKRAGVLLPLSQLPSPHGIGTMGKAAFGFVDWLASAGMKIWQVLPLQPTGYGDSPYQSCSAGALNPYFIDLDLLEEEGLLEREEYADADWGADARRVDYAKLFSRRAAVLRRAYARLDKTARDWRDFCAKGEFYDFALYMACKEACGYKPYAEWGTLRDGDSFALRAFAAEHAEDIGFWQFTQYAFLKQWRALKGYANARGVEIMGDMPIYVAADSAEMWLHGKELFLLDGEGNPAAVAGVPPDAFSDSGQLWGNPVYDWEKMKADGYGWWRRRIARALELYDIVRIDHFRGFDRFYAIPADSADARVGTWEDGPKEALFQGLEGAKIVAEDLGTIDDGVRSLMRKTGYPGMKVMEFGFNGDPYSEHKPQNFPANCVAYTGTHDNSPLVGYIEGLDGNGRKVFDADLKGMCRALGVRRHGSDAKSACRAATEALFASAAETVVLPMHDVLCLGEEARINRPSLLSPLNWSFRLSAKDFRATQANRLRRLAEKYGR